MRLGKFTKTTLILTGVGAAIVATILLFAGKAKIKAKREKEILPKPLLAIVLEYANYQFCPVCDPLFDRIKANIIKFATMNFIDPITDELYLHFGIRKQRFDPPSLELSIHLKGEEITVSQGNRGGAHYLYYDIDTFIHRLLHNSLGDERNGEAPPVHINGKGTFLNAKLLKRLKSRLSM